MRKFLFACGMISLMLFTLTACGSEDPAEEISRALHIDVSAGEEISSSDTHGGFHGDGILTAVVKLPDSQAGENAVPSIAEQWKPLPIEEDWMEQFQSVWTDHGQTLGVLPQNTEGFWFYRDRYKERYGEVCYPNPVMQN